MHTVTPSCSLASTRRGCLALLALLALTPSRGEDEAAAPQVTALLEDWAQRTKDLRALRVEFEQTKHLRLLRRPLQSRGVSLLKGKRLRMDVHNAAGELELVLQWKPGEVRLYHPRLRRQEVYPLPEDAAPPETPFLVMGEDVRELPRRYRVTLEAGGGLETLVLVPRAEGAQVTSLRLEFQERRLVAVEQQDRSGGRVRMKITRWEQDPELPDAALELELPPGTEVVQAGAGAPSPEQAR